MDGIGLEMGRYDGIGLIGWIMDNLCILRMVDNIGHG